MPKFPVNFPVSSEIFPETGSTMTGTSATQCARSVKARDHRKKARHLVEFSTTANSLHVPKLGKYPASSPKVSTELLNYSRFLELPVGGTISIVEWVPTCQS